MAKRARVVWKGVNEVKVGMNTYGESAHRAIGKALDYWAPVLEGYAKTNAPWTDRTANARSGLYAWKQRDGAAWRLYLSHAVYYGIFLELRWAGKYAIIGPTLDLHQARVMKMLRDIFA